MGVGALGRQAQDVRNAYIGGEVGPADERGARTGVRPLWPAAQAELQHRAAAATSWMRAALVAIRI